MLPSFVEKGQRIPIGLQKGDLRLAGANRQHAADARDASAMDGAWDPGPAGSGEEELIIFAAVEGLIERIGQRTGERVNWKGGFFDFGMKPRALA